MTYVSAFIMPIWQIRHVHSLHEVALNSNITRCRWHIEVAHSHTYRVLHAHPPSPPHLLSEIPKVRKSKILMNINLLKNTAYNSSHLSRHVKHIHTIKQVQKMMDLLPHKTNWEAECGGNPP